MQTYGPRRDFAADVRLLAIAAAAAVVGVLGTLAAHVPQRSGRPKLAASRFTSVGHGLSLHALDEGRALRLQYYL